MDQFLTMAFAQLTYRESLRDIEINLRAQAKRLYHMGLRCKTVSRNTLANAFFVTRAKSNTQFKRRYSHPVLLSALDLSRRFPWINTDDIELGALGIDGEGWFDGPALHQAFLKKALKLGVIKIQAEVVRLQRETSLSPPEQGHRRSEQKIRSIVLNDGRQIHSDIYICAAGAWPGQLLKSSRH